MYILLTHLHIIDMKMAFNCESLLEV